jgi:hypothetical protein
MTMPAIPRALLDRLGLQNVESFTAFKDDKFVKMIAGRQDGPVLNSGTWSGVFGGTSGVTLASFMSKHKTYGGEGDHKVQPTGANIGVLSQLSGQSAWSIIQGNCDPQLNDIFTDIVYEENADGKIKGVPAIWIRGKCLRMLEVEGIYKDASGTNEIPGDVKEALNTWTLFGDLPRIRIDTVNIVGISINQTIMNTPTYIVPEFRDSTSNFDSGIKGTIGMLSAQRFDNAMLRFGGRDLSIASSYYGTTALPLWSKTKVWLATSWYSMSHKLCNGTLFLKNGDTPISIGMNIQFKLGQFDMLAQVDTISENFRIDANGTKVMQTKIGFSHMCVAYGNILSFLPNGAANDLYNSFGNPAWEVPLAAAKIASGLPGIDFNELDFETIG